MKPLAERPIRNDFGRKWLWLGKLTGRYKNLGLQLAGLALACDVPGCEVRDQWDASDFAVRRAVDDMRIYYHLTCDPRTQKGLMCNDRECVINWA